MSSVGLASIHVEGFRSVRDARFRPGRISALVGEASVGKSNLLAAIRCLLDPESAPLVPRDVTTGGGEPIKISGRLVEGSDIAIEGTPPDVSVRGGERPPVVFLPADLRSKGVVAASHHAGPEARQALKILREVIPAPPGEDAYSQAATEAAHGLVAGLEAWRDAQLGGLVLLIEEPELFLPPQSQRYLYHLLRHLAGAGNQVLYSTHSPAFLNVTRLEELVLIHRRPDAGTRLLQPESLPPDEEFRAYSEFDAARSELFLARAAVLVEGLTEKLALPFVFRALGHDPDRERISIVECGGKSNIPLIAQISKVVGVPFIAVHDRDAPAGKEPNQAEQQLNELIAEVAGKANRIELVPDFEGTADLRGHRHKPARAWRNFADLEAGDIPKPLARVVRLAVALNRPTG